MKYLFLVICFIGLSSLVFADNFGPFECEDECEGHDAGYNRAENNFNTLNPLSCLNSKSKSFAEGCYWYFQEGRNGFNKGRKLGEENISYLVTNQLSCSNIIKEIGINISQNTLYGGQINVSSLLPYTYLGCLQYLKNYLSKSKDGASILLKDSIQCASIECYKSIDCKSIFGNRFNNYLSSKEDISILDDFFEVMEENGRTNADEEYFKDEYGDKSYTSQTENEYNSFKSICNSYLSSKISSQPTLNHVIYYIKNNPFTVIISVILLYFIGRNILLYHKKEKQAKLDYQDKNNKKEYLVNKNKNFLKDVELKLTKGQTLNNDVYSSQSKKVYAYYNFMVNYMKDNDISYVTYYNDIESIYKEFKEFALYNRCITSVLSKIQKDKYCTHFDYDELDEYELSPKYLALAKEKISIILEDNQRNLENESYYSDYY